LVKSIVTEQLKQACRCIKIIEQLKQNKLDQLKQEYLDLIKNNTGNSSGMMDEEDTKDPEAVVMPKVLEHLNSIDQFGNTPLNYAVKNRNIFLIIYLMLINKVKVSHVLVDLHLCDHSLCDMERMTI